MTGFIAAAAPVQLHRKHDVRLQARWVKGEGEGEGEGFSSFRSLWWPRGAGLLGDAGGVGILEAVAFDLPEITRGTSSRFGIVGVTRDVYGSPLGNCVVKCFRTSTDELVSQISSDTNGVFTITTHYYPDTHYLVSYKTGAPDVEGTTVNTLVGG